MSRESSGCRQSSCRRDLLCPDWRQRQLSDEIRGWHDRTYAGLLWAHQRAELLKGNPQTIEAHNSKLQGDPVTGELGELGFGTQVLPFSGRDIQDEKIRGTIHVATGRSHHLGGDLTPAKFANPENATHDDILFAPQKTPEIRLRQARMLRNGKIMVLIEDYNPAEYMNSLVR